MLEGLGGTVANAARAGDVGGGQLDLPADFESGSVLDDCVGLEPFPRRSGGSDLGVGVESAFLGSADDAGLVSLVFVAHGGTVPVSILAVLVDGFAAPVGLLPQVHPRNDVAVHADPGAPEAPLGDRYTVLGVYPV
ncbi:hypothetical protein AB0D92_30305 [Streptomyces parvus]|uniref:hypothetical protein n=1 Tax=Streptomyces parvus TaxID=66428 RepID=UPI0033F18B4F